MKIKYNNYQFYESEAIETFLNEKKSEGYVLTRTVGGFFNVLKFNLEKEDVSTKYLILRKRFDRKIDEKIEILKQNKTKTISESSLYIIFEISKEDYEKTEIKKIKEEQSKLLGVPLKKSLFYIILMSVLTIMTTILSFLLIDNGNFMINVFSLIISLVLSLSFFLYFIGDVHDYFKGYKVFENKKLYFKSRSKVKNSLFLTGDIVKFGAIILSVVFVFIILLSKIDTYSLVKVIFIIIISALGIFLDKMRYNNSYISLLLVGLFIQIINLNLNLRFE